MIESANNLSNLHQNLVDHDSKLKTKIILKDTLSTSFHTLNKCYVSSEKLNVTFLKTHNTV